MDKSANQDSTDNFVEQCWTLIGQRRDRFYHTHPGGSSEPSRRDLQTMRAWVGSFGKPLLCLIQAGECVSAFRFENDECEGIALEQCELFPDEIVVALERDSCAVDPDTESETNQRKM